MHSIYKHILAFTLLAVIPGRRIVVKAQDLAGLPDCAKPALLAAFQASGCSPSDTDSLCANPQLLTSLQSYIQGACSPADQAAVLAYGQTYCSVLSSATSSMAMANSTPSATLSVSKTTTATPSATSTGGAVETGMSVAALAVAMGGMGWLFAEL